MSPRTCQSGGRVSFTLHHSTTLNLQPKFDLKCSSFSTLQRPSYFSKRVARWRMSYFAQDLDGAKRKEGSFASCASADSENLNLIMTLHVAANPGIPIRGLSQLSICRSR
ncbi:hypothetical protein PV325_006875 [Microctonus aethiopoides]|nr:hypothetical protein PV325_006875 [Microctonus aethiopoides]KAK0093354.1 hypothetical protein PV326_013744 [Microctonus aethiopoides]